MRAKEQAAELALRVGAELGESPVWDERRQELFFLDILAGRVHAYCPGTGGHRFFSLMAPVGAIALRKDGGLLLAAQESFVLAAEDGSTVVPFGAFRIDAEQVRFNDGKVDAAGRFVAGTMHRDGVEPVGALYRLSGDATVERLLDGITISNGIAFSSDGSTLYYIDSVTQTVDALAFEEATGRLASRRVVAEVGGGSPDGMAIDDEGLLWVAVFEGGRVERIDPLTGQTVSVVRVPTPQVTSVAFGGRSLTQLFITTAHEGFDEGALLGDPHAGDLFVADVGVSGPLAHRFAGGPRVRGSAVACPA